MKNLDELATKLKAFGAPGDYGYGTPAGDALFLAHQILAAAYAAVPPAGVAAIAAERRRQIESEGWTAAHDDQWRNGELARAATTYCLTAWPRDLADLGFAGRLWPFGTFWLRPTTRRRDLVKAGALIAAEIDRIDRAAAR